MTKPKKLPSLEELKELFEYNPMSGRVVWKIDQLNRGKWTARRGAEVGCINNKGYRVVTLGRRGRGQRRMFYVHRIAWKMFYGEDPPQFLDHVDRDRTNNSIINLRQASNKENAANRSIHPRNKSGCPGVFWDRTRKAWKASIGHKHVGTFRDYESAVAARERAAFDIFGVYSPHDHDGMKVIV